MFYGKWLLSYSGTEMFWGSLRSAHFFHRGPVGPWLMTGSGEGCSLVFLICVSGPWSFLEGRTFLSTCLTLWDLWKHVAMGFFVVGCGGASLHCHRYVSYTSIIHSFMHSYIHSFIDLEILYLLSARLREYNRDQKSQHLLS